MSTTSTDGKRARMVAIAEGIPHRTTTGDDGAAGSDVDTTDA
jgi:hypothetical protein